MKPRNTKNEQKVLETRVEHGADLLHSLQEEQSHLCTDLGLPTSRIKVNLLLKPLSGDLVSLETNTGNTLRYFWPFVPAD